MNHLLSRTWAGPGGPLPRARVPLATSCAGRRGSGANRQRRASDDEASDAVSWLSAPWAASLSVRAALLPPLGTCRAGAGAPASCRRLSLSPLPLPGLDRQAPIARCCCRESRSPVRCSSRRRSVAAAVDVWGPAAAPHSSSSEEELARRHSLTTSLVRRLVSCAVVGWVGSVSSSSMPPVAALRACGADRPLDATFFQLDN